MGSELLNQSSGLWIAVLLGRVEGSESWTYKSHLNLCWL